MSASVRVLGAGDEAALEAFLVRHADSSMFLRANSRAVGLVDAGQPLQATYAAAFDEHTGRIVAVAAHCWNGMVLVQVPAPAGDLLGVLVRQAVTRSRGRRVSGFAGPYAQAVAARAALGLADAPAAMDSRDDLFALELYAMSVPPRLAAGACAARAPLSHELDLVTAWRVAYMVELMGSTPGPQLERDCRQDVEHWRANGNSWLLLEAGEPVAYSGFNARLPDVVQVGGVYTPPALRGRGHARAVVAASLLEARATGAHRAILFTGSSNVAARAAYLRLGFQIVGDYGLVLLRT